MSEHKYIEFFDSGMRFGGIHYIASEQLPKDTILCHPDLLSEFRVFVATSESLLIAQNDDPELLEWLANARDRGGHFISSVAKAALVADHDNYPRMRAFVIEMRVKYPDYEPSEQVKQEIRDRKPDRRPI